MGSERYDFNAYLPSTYGGIIKSQERNNLEVVKEGLIQSLELGDVQHGLNHYIRLVGDILKLHSYNNIGANDIALFAHVIYDAICIPNIDYSFQTKWCNVLNRVLRYANKVLSKDDKALIQLDWRKIYNVLISTHLISLKRGEDSTNRAFMGTKLFVDHARSLHRVIKHAKPYFSNTIQTTKDILNEVTVFTVPFSDNIFRAQSILCNFLPSNSLEAVEIWLDPVLHLWHDGWVNNYPSWHANWLTLIGTMGKKLHGQISWSPERVRILFSIISRFVQLEVHDPRLPTPMEKSVPSDCSSFSSARDPNFKLPSVGKIIVYLLGNSIDEDTSAQSLLTELLRSIAAYYHPSNGGNWTKGFAALLQSLICNFAKRLKKERSSPDIHKKLDEKAISEFLDSIDLVLPNALLSRDRDMNFAGITAISTVAFIDPKRVENIVVKLLSSLEAVEELEGRQSPTNIINILSYLIAPLVENKDIFPNGIALLNSMVSVVVTNGIAANDASKTLATLRFLLSFLYNIPLETPSSFSSASEGDEFVVEFAATFPDIAHTVLDNVLSFVSALEKPEKRDSFHFMFQFQNTLRLFFAQLSDDIYKELLAKVKNFLQQNVYPNASKEVGVICKTIVAANPKQGLHAILPTLATKLKNEHSGDEEKKWYLQILATAVEASGVELLTYSTSLKSILTHYLNVETDKEVFIIATDVLQGIITALTYTYAIDYHSVPKPIREQPNFNNVIPKYWGSKIGLEQVEVQWHIPNEQEIAFATEIAKTFTTTALETLAQFLKKETVDFSFNQTLFKHLHLLRAIAKSSTVITGWDISTFKKRHDKKGMVPLNHLQIVVGETTTLKFKEEVGNALHGFIAHCSSIHYQDVSVLKEAAKLINDVLNPIESSAANSGRQKSYWKALKQKMSNPTKGQKERSRILLVQRLNTQHFSYINAKRRSSVERSVTVNSLLLDIVKLSLNPFSSIRKSAQKTLAKSCKNIYFAISELVPKLLEKIEEPSSEDHEVKGAAYSLLNEQIIRKLAREWKYFSPAVSSIIQTFKREKASVQEKIIQLFMAIVVSHCSPSIQQPRDYVTNLASKYGRPVSADLQAEANARQQFYVKKNTESLQSCVASLISAFSTANKLHWKHQMIVGMSLLLIIKAADTLLGDLLSVVVASFLGTISKSMISKDASSSIRSLGVNSIMFFLSRFLKSNKESRSFTDITGEEAQNELALLSQDINQLLNFQPSATTKFIDNRFLGWSNQGSWTVQTLPKPASDTTAFKSILDSIGDLIQHLVRDHKSPTPEGVPQGGGARSNIPDMSSISTLLAKFGIDLQAFKTSERDQRQNIGHFFASFNELVLEGRKKAIMFQLPESKETIFNASNARMFKLLFTVFRTSLLDVVRPHLELLCSSTERDSLSMVSEIYAGLIHAGSKHWQNDENEIMWQFVSSTLPQLLWNSSFESLPDWTNSVKFMVRYRDPRRMVPLVKILLAPLQSNNTNIQLKALQYLIPVLEEFSWRSTSIGNYIASFINSVLLQQDNIPSHLMREQIGSILSIILQNQWRPQPNSLFPSPPARPSEEITSLLASFNQRFTMTGDNIALKTALNSTLVFTFEFLLSRGVVLDVLTAFTVQFLHNLFKATTDIDKDIVKTAKKELGVLARDALYSKQSISLILDAIKQLAHDPNWHLREIVPPFFQIVVHTSWYSLTKSQQRACVQYIIDLLQDPQVEVRELAGNALSLLLRPYSDMEITALRDTFLKLAGSAATKRRSPSSNPNGDAQRELERHAGVLGLSSLVSMAPYTIPPWLPGALVGLTRQFSAISLPTHKTVKSAFADFWRTHKDAWATEHSTHFDYDQLDAINELLVSPSYYS